MADGNDSQVVLARDDRRQTSRTVSAVFSGRPGPAHSEIYVSSRRWEGVPGENRRIPYITDCVLIFFFERSFLLSVIRIRVACHETISTRRAGPNVGGWRPRPRDCGESESESDRVRTHFGCVGARRVHVGVLFTVLEGCATEGFGR
jgi:hypothetical protein